VITAESRIAPARAPRPRIHSERLLVIDPLSQRFGDYHITELPGLLGPGDVLVLNDAATLPASLRVDEGLELRLVAAEPTGDFWAIALGAGDWSLPTEERGSPPLLRAGQRLQFNAELAARVLHVDPSEALLRLRFEIEGAAFFAALYRHAEPIQYSYASRGLKLWDVQNGYAGRPWAFELPSAGRPLTFEILFGVEERGARLTYVTHAASISSTGSATLDARLPLAERYEISADAADALTWSRKQGGRVIAAGTSVVRALESAATPRGSVAAGEGETELRLSEAHEPRVVDGLLTGLHEPGSSHFELLTAFARRSLLVRAMDHAARTGYLQHEFGDSCLVLAGALLSPLRA